MANEPTQIGPDGRRYPVGQVPSLHLLDILGDEIRVFGVPEDGDVPTHDGEEARWAPQGQGPQGETGDMGPAGPAGPPGPGLPSGGTTGQVPVKASAAPMHYEFRDFPTGGSGEGGSGEAGADGASAYEVAVSNGFVGTEADWLVSLVGTDGADGPSAYEVAVENGFVGSESDWLASLVGDDSTVPGPPGPPGEDGETGPPGADGADGADGPSAYEVAVQNGFVGTEAAWLASLEGPTGPAGQDGTDGQDGAPGADSTVPGPAGETGPAGADGPSAYEVAVTEGFVGDEAAWLASLVGPVGEDSTVPGPPGPPGEDGQDGATGPAGEDGATAYELAVSNGFVGTEAAWVESLVGPTGSDGADSTVPGPPGPPGEDGPAGEDGPSAYEVAVANGFVGTEAAWLLSLVGPKGDQGDTGAAGSSGTDLRRYMYRTGAIRENVERYNASASVAQTNAKAMLVAVPLKAGDVITDIEFARSVALGTPVNWWFALLNSALQTVAVTANQTTAAWGVELKKLALSSAYTVPTTGIYYAVCLSHANTPGSLYGHNGASILTAAAPQYAFEASGTIVSPPSNGFAFAFGNGIVGTPWVALYGTAA